MKFSSASEEALAKFVIYQPKQSTSSSSVSELLQPFVALASRVGTSYQKTIMTQPQTRNSYRIDRRAGQQRSRTG